MGPPANRDIHELALAMYSLWRWEELGSESGRDLGFRRTGILCCTTNIGVERAWSGLIDTSPC